LALVDEAVERNVEIIVTEGRISSIALGGAAASDAKRLRGFTIPGMANAHSHAFHRALRSRTQANRGTFWTWRELMYRAAERLTPENYHRLARATFGEMALAGITAVGEFHYVHHQSDGTRYDEPNAMGTALLAAAAEAGIRIALLDTLYLHGGLDADGYLDPTGAQGRYSDGGADAWVARIDDLDPAAGQIVGAAVHSVRAVDPDSITTHVSEQTAENDQCFAHHGCTPIELLQECGLLGSNFSAVHATHLSTTDIRLLQESGSAVCMCPTTERDLGDGVGPTRAFVDAGIPISLGSDSHAVIDHFEEARAVELDERLVSRERGIHSAANLTRMAGAGGHQSLGWHDAGTLAVGQRADLVTIALDSPRTAGADPTDPLSAAIFAATAADVRSVVVDGRLIVDDHHHLTVDVATELHAAITDLMED
jgi:formiminoglutamate deiminase